MRISFSRLPAPPQATASMSGSIRICAHDVGLKLIRRHEQRFHRVLVFVGNADAFKHAPGGLIIAFGREAGACAVFAILVNDKALAWHDVEHAVDQRLGNEWPPRCAAAFRVSAIVLRPKAVKNEIEAASVAPVALRFVVARTGLRAVRRAPRENECVVVEFAWHVALLGLRVQPLARPGIAIVPLLLLPVALALPIARLGPYDTAPAIVRASAAAAKNLSAG